MSELELMQGLWYGIPLAFLAGFIDAIAGGGGTITLPTLLFMGLSPAQAAATNKLLAVFGSSSASLTFWRRGQVEGPLVLRLGGLALLGSALGASLVIGFQNDALFRLIVAGLVVLVGCLVLFQRRMGLENRYPGLTPRTLWIGGLGALLIGIYDGFLGPGTGTFLMFLFVQFLLFDFVRGTGNAKVINFVTNAGALVTFLFGGKILFMIGLPMGLANAAGAVLGARAAMLRGSAFVKAIYLGIVVLVVLRLILLR